jgi:glycosyltransferase involved in cell wall biosynthesis
MLQRLRSGTRHILMTTDAIGGVWQYTLDLARELTLLGDSVTLVGLGPEPSPEQRHAAEEVVAELAWLNTPPDWLAEDEAELDRFPAEIAPFLRDKAIDIVHVNNPGLAADLEVDIPLVVVSHSCVTTWFEAVRGSPPDARWAWHKTRNQEGFRRAEAVLAPSASHAALLSQCYGAMPHLQIVHNGITDRFGPSDQEAMVFAAARWWDEGKNASLLEAAAAQSKWPVFAAGPVVGPNGEHVDFRHAISLGTRPNGEIRRLMARSEIFVSPSLYEPFGLAVLEAASAGTALLLADIPTYRELWTDAALFFSPHDPNSLAELLNRLTRNKHERRVLAAAAQYRAKTFTLTRQVEQMRMIYDRAVTTHASRS